MVFKTTLSLLTKFPKFKKNDSCAECFDANFQQQDSCARCFGQVFDCYQKTQSSSKSKVAQSVLTQIMSNRTVAHSLFEEFQPSNKSLQIQEKRQQHRVFLCQFLGKGQLRALFGTCFSFLTKVGNLEQNDSCAKCFDGNFEQQDSWARSFGQVLAVKQKSPI